MSCKPYKITAKFTRRSLRTQWTDVCVRDKPKEHAKSADIGIAEGTGQGQRHGKIEITPGDKFTAKGNICVGKGFIFFLLGKRKAAESFKSTFLKGTTTPTLLGKS